MSEIARNSTGLSGEYFVAAELYRRGWSVGMTIGNAKAVDLFAEKDDIVVQIQVKSIFKRSNSGWPMHSSKVKADCVYIFVNLNADKMGQPDYYICSSTEALKAVDDYGSRGIVTVGKVKKLNFLDQWDKLLSHSKKIRVRKRS